MSSSPYQYFRCANCGLVAEERAVEDMTVCSFRGNLYEPPEFEVRCDSCGDINSFEQTYVCDTDGCDNEIADGFDTCSTCTEPSALATCTGGACA